MIKGSKHTIESRNKSSKSHKGQIAWNYNKVSKTCSFCRVKFLVSPTRSKSAKFCSRKCKQKSQIGIPPKNIKGLNIGRAWNKGIHAKTNDALDVWRENGGGVGEKNHTWKGNSVGYSGLHSWIRRCLGKPTKCEHCGKDGLFGQKIHWANKSGKYLRNLTDWIRLCVRCHSAYDRNIKAI